MTVRAVAPPALCPATYTTHHAPHQAGVANKACLRYAPAAPHLYAALPTLTRYSLPACAAAHYLCPPPALHFCANATPVGLPQRLLAFGLPHVHMPPLPSVLAACTPVSPAIAHIPRHALPCLPLPFAAFVLYPTALPSMPSLPRGTCAHHGTYHPPPTTPLMPTTLPQWIRLHRIACPHIHLNI